MNSSNIQAKRLFNRTDPSLVIEQLISALSLPQISWSSLEQLFSTEQKEQGYKINLFKIVPTLSTNIPALTNGSTLFQTLKEYLNSTHLPLYTPSLHKRLLPSPLRRLLWSHTLDTSRNRQEFYKYDSGTYLTSTLQQQLRSALSNHSLTQLQLNNATHLLYYIRSKHGRVPRTHEVFLAILTVDTYSCHKDNIGGIYVGLIEIGESMGEGDIHGNRGRGMDSSLNMSQITSQSMSKGMKMGDTYTNTQQSKYISQAIQLIHCVPHFQVTQSLLKLYHLFRISLGGSMIQLKGCAYLIDMLFIRQKCKKDIYVYFAMALLINKQHEGQENTLISWKDIVAAYKVVYEDVSVPLKQSARKNKLLEWMMQDQSPKESFVIQKQNKIWIGNIKK